MRSGVIRPRTFARPPEKDDDDNGKGYRGFMRLRRSLVMILLSTLVVLLFWVAFGHESNDVSVSVNVDLDIEEGATIKNAKNLNGGYDEDNIGEDETNDINNSEQADEEKDKNNDEDEEFDKEEADDVVMEENPKNQDDEDEDIFANLQSLSELEHHHKKKGKTTSSTHRDSSFSTTFHHEKVEPIKWTLENYFLKLGKSTVNISPSGSFKFVIVLGKDLNEDGAVIVQGCSYKSKTCKHPDAARYVTKHLEAHGIKAKILGGGRITRHRLRKSEKQGLISVFGHSRSYGKCEDCNRQTCLLISEAYPNHVVRWSNQGYSESDENIIKDWKKCSQEVEELKEEAMVTGSR